MIQTYPTKNAWTCRVTPSSEGSRRPFSFIANRPQWTVPGRLAGRRPLRSPCSLGSRGHHRRRRIRGIVWGRCLDWVGRSRARRATRVDTRAEAPTRSSVLLIYRFRHHVCPRTAEAGYRTGFRRGLELFLRRQAGDREWEADLARRRRKEPVGERTLLHSFPVRAGLITRFALPADLTTSEADRLVQFIRSLAVES